jgi:hypothetical protein
MLAKNPEFLRRLMSKQFLLALGFTQIGHIPTGNSGNCGRLCRKLSQCHHNGFFQSKIQDEMLQNIRCSTQSNLSVQENILIITDFGEEPPFSA